MRKNNKTTLILSVAFMAIIAFGLAFSASAQNAPISQNQADIITNECATFKATLTQLHSNDALLRVNAGQTYESILSRLMKRFNERASYNNMDYSELSSISSSFETTLNTFRSDYVIYEQQLSVAMNINCSVLPQGFYDAVMMARTYRTKVNQDVLALNGLMDQYSAALDRFEANNQKITERPIN